MNLMKSRLMQSDNTATSKKKTVIASMHSSYIVLLLWSEDINAYPEIANAQI
jgi:hypothetical protein